MKPEFDGEIDALLRGAARRGGAWPAARGGHLPPRPIPNGAAAGSHLDADEIAAFGGSALPAAARARYSSHLADCDDCRRSVAQVALAAGAADSIEERGRESVPAPAAAQSPSWRERLAAIFAPRAWRYAMPAVALVAVSAVVLIVARRVPREEAALTQEGGGRAVATRQAPAPAAPEPIQAGATPSQQTSPPQSTGQSGGVGAGGAAPTPGAGRESRAAGDVAKQGGGTVDRVGQSAADSPAGTAGARPELAQRGATQLPPAGAPTFAEELTAMPTPAPPPPPATALPMVMRNAATPAPPPGRANVEAGAAARDDSRNSAPRDEAPSTKRHGPQRGIAGGGREAAELASAAAESKDERESRRARRPARRAAASRDESAKQQSVPEEDREQQQGETRSAGGRRFRSVRGVWIDTAYKPQQATIVVRVNSEQYRALVADEPEIGRISRALGGEVVIVWKGRAYRVKP